MRNTDFDREIAMIARRQHGVFHTSQAREVGGTRHVIANRAANGTIVKLAPRIWAVASQPATWQRQYKAAELSVPGSALCERSAALIHDLEGSRVLRPVVVAPSTANVRQRLGDVRRSGDARVTTVDGFRVTTVAQTLFDLLECCDVPFVERAMDGALLERSVTVDDLLERRDALDGSRRPNVGTWRSMVAERSSDAWVPTESDLEVLLEGVLRRLPASVVVERQATPPWWSGAGLRVDAHIPEWRLIVEADGRRWHSRARDFDRDRWRDNLAVANGHRVLRFTHTHLAEDPGGVLALILASGPVGLVPPLVA